MKSGIQVTLFSLVFTASVSGPGQAASRTAINEFVDRAESFTGQKLASYVEAFARRHPRNPIVEDERILLLIAPEQQALELQGDFNSWGRYERDHDARPGAQLVPRPVGETGWRYLVTSAVRNARLQYALAGAEGMLQPDLRNPDIAVSFGIDVSEIRMRDFRERLIDLPAARAAGRIEEHVLINPGDGREHALHVYLPHGYDDHPGARFPSVWFHDGRVYLRQIGAAGMLDSLISSGALPSVVAVFMDPANRREDYRRSETYRRFVTDITVPFVTNRYRIQREATSRTIVGSSRGALAALDLTLGPQPAFGQAALLSPALSPIPILEDLMAQRETAVRYRIAGGRYDLRFIGDYHRLLDALRSIGADVHGQIYSEGHNPAAWQRYLPEMLLRLHGSVYGDTAPRHH